MRLTLALALVLVPAVAHAHETGAGAGERLAPAIALAVGAAAYGAGLARVRRRRGSIGGARLWATLAGALVTAGALLSPLDGLAAQLFSAHMAQHTLLTVVAAPLLALGRPLAVVAAALPPRSALARAALRWRPGMALAWGAHGLELWLWHLPPLYSWALASPALHAVEHATLLGTAVMLWWSVSWQGRPLAGALWLFTTALHTSVLGALMTLTPHPWFAAHAAGAAGLTGLEDQQLAGLVMWVPAGTLLTAFTLALLAAWFRRAERQTPSLGAMLVALVAVTAALTGCNDTRATAVTLTGGDPGRGRDALRAYGCHTCHTIPGVPGADATVGPSLAQLAGRGYVAGRPNAPDQLMAWIRHPQKLRPGTPMPEMAVTESDARHIAAYLYTLR
jgi:cytochrome c oxidase assembly factor CtaG/cytochrome c2